jgi:hypothetical protein
LIADAISLGFFIEQREKEIENETQDTFKSDFLSNDAEDLWNYMYRTFLSHILVAKAFGSKEHVDILTKYKLEFEKRAGENY